MNREWILTNLHEAQEELNRIIAILESAEDYEEAEFEIDVAQQAFFRIHVYSQLTPRRS